MKTLLIRSLNQIASNRVVARQGDRAEEEEEREGGGREEREGDGAADRRADQGESETDRGGEGGPAREAQRRTSYDRLPVRLQEGPDRVHSGRLDPCGAHAQRFGRFRRQLPAIFRPGQGGVRPQAGPTDGDAEPRAGRPKLPLPEPRPPLLVGSAPDLGRPRAELHLREAHAEQRGAPAAVGVHRVSRFNSRSLANGLHTGRCAGDVRRPRSARPKVVRETAVDAERPCGARASVHRVATTEKCITNYLVNRIHRLDYQLE